ncbi:MAG: MASE1 domain-containing protein [Pirellulales bacterium]|nr:MASE1 domain-containing protein [Pirellulales bacterium]
MRSGLMARAGTILTITAAYLLAAKLGLSLAFATEQVSVVWPASGLALAAVMLWGRNVWPGIALGAFLANATANEPLWVATLIACGNTGEALLGAWLLERVVDFRRNLRRIQDVLGLILLAAGASTMFSATVGVTSLCLGNVQPWSDWKHLWQTWWLGDGLGVLVIAPVLLTWSEWRRQGKTIESLFTIESVALAIGVATVSSLAFFGTVNSAELEFQLKYAIFPLVIWAALRFGPRGSASAVLLSLAINLLAAASEMQRLSAAPVEEGLIQLQIYMAVVATTGLLLAAAASERDAEISRAQLGQAVTTALTTTESPDRAAQQLIATVCEHLDWDVGAVWTLDSAGTSLRSVGVWQRADRSHDEFAQATRAMTFAPGVGLPGRVWLRQEAIWIADVTRDDHFLRAAVAARCGLHAACTFPIVLGTRFLGVIEFFHRQIQPSDPELLATMSAIGVQAGLFIERWRTQESLRQREHELTDFLESAALGIQWIDADGTIVWANRALLETLGYERGEFIGHNILEFHFDRTAARDILVRMVQGEAVLDFETRLRAKNGSAHDVLMSSNVYREGGRFAYTRCFVRDVTENKRAEQATQFLADAGSLLAALDDPESTLQEIAALAVPTFADWCVVRMVAPDDSLRVVAIRHVDEAKTELGARLYERYPPRCDLPFGAPHIVATGASELVTELTPEMLQATAQNAEHLEMLVQLALVSYLGVPLRVRGRIVGIVMFGTAESRRRFDAADLAVAEEIARRASLALENAQLYAEVRLADRRKDEFLAVLAHELRNPLAPICSALEILKLPDLETASIDEAHQLIDRQVRHLVRLVDDLLDLARIMQGKIELRMECIDLVATVRRALETAAPTVQTGQHQLEVSLPDEPIYVDADPVRLVQVLSNLINNAAKYTERGGSIAVRCELEGRLGVVRVRDTGIGIAGHLLAPIFEPFFQADEAVRRAQGGMGMGLSLARRLAELHGGSIRAMSAGIGKGSEFIVRLPAVLTKSVSSDEPPGDADASEHDATIERRRTMVVDDNADVAQSLAMLLRLTGQHVRVANDGQTALELARAETPEIVFLDLGMPEMDGFAVAGAFRADPTLRRCVLVALTGWGQEEDRRRTREAGFDHHLVKPASLADVQRILAESNPRQPAGDAATTS